MDSKTQEFIRLVEAAEAEAKRIIQYGSAIGATQGRVEAAEMTLDNLSRIKKRAEDGSLPLGVNLGFGKFIGEWVGDWTEGFALIKAGHAIEEFHRTM